MDIGVVLTRAWQITWKYKILWLFGILAGCGSSGGGGSNGGGSGGNGSSASSLLHFNGDGFALLSRLRTMLFDGLMRWADDISPWLIFLFVLLGIGLILLLIVVSITLSTVGRIGLIQGTVQAEAGAERLGFGELFKSGLPYFWRVLLLVILVAICAIIVALLVVVPVGIFTCGVGFLLLLPFAWFVAVLVEQATAAIVVDDLTITDGLSKGWEVIRDNLGIMIVMSLILYLLLGLLVGLIVALPAIVLVMPLMLGIILGAITETELIAGGGLILTLGLLACYIPIAVLISGVLRTYVGSAWTLTYLKLGKALPVTP